MSDAHTTAASVSPASGAEAGTLAALRVPRDDRNLLAGFGPLAAAIALFLLMVLLVPSIAPERIIERPATAKTPAANTIPASTTPATTVTTVTTPGSVETTTP